MPSQDPTQDYASALAHAQAALSQLTFHLDVQQSATDRAAALVQQIKQQLHHTEARPTHSNLPICPIDLEPIKREDVRVLACGHVYHAECIGHWLEFSNTCPLDRSIVEMTDATDGASNGSATDDERTLGDSESTAPTIASSRTSSFSSVVSDGSVDMSLIETLAFHHRLIAEQELLVARAEELVFEGTEVGLNVRWAEFLRVQIEGLAAGAAGVEDEILGPDENDGVGSVDGDGAGAGGEGEVEGV